MDSQPDKSPRSDTPSTNESTIPQQSSASQTLTEPAPLASQRDIPHEEKTGRSWADLAIKILPVGAIVLPIALIAAAYLDLIDIHYDNGWKFRLGVDHEEIAKRKEEQDRIAQLKQAAEWSSGLQNRLHSFVIGTWNASWDVPHKDGQVTVDDGRACGWVEHTNMSLDIKEYDPVQNTGRGKVAFRSTYSGAVLDDDELVQQSMARKQAQCLRAAHINAGNATTATYSIFFRHGEAWQITAQLYQTACGSSCSEIERTFVVLPTQEIDYVDPASGYGAGTRRRLTKSHSETALP